MNKYKCKHCKGIILRDSKKQWVKSYCGKTGKTAHMRRL